MGFHINCKKILWQFETPGKGWKRQNEKIISCSIYCAKSSHILARGNVSYIDILFKVKRSDNNWHQFTFPTLPRIPAPPTCWQNWAEGVSPVKLPMLEVSSKEAGAVEVASHTAERKVKNYNNTRVGGYWVEVR